MNTWWPFQQCKFTSTNHSQQHSVNKQSLFQSGIPQLKEASWITDETPWKLTEGCLLASISMVLLALTVLASAEMLHLSHCRWCSLFMFPILKCCFSAADGNNDNCRHNQISHHRTPTSVRHVNSDDANSKHVDYSDAEKKTRWSHYVIWPHSLNGAPQAAAGAFGFYSMSQG